MMLLVVRERVFDSCVSHIFHGTGSFTYVGCIIYTTNIQNGYSAL